MKQMFEWSVHHISNSGVGAALRLSSALQALH